MYFEKENIWTLDAKGELLITIMSSLAQEESRSISENTTWGQRKRFADGKVSVPYKRFLGYDKGPNGTLVVNREQAETVKEIYRLFLAGYTFHSIAAELTRRGIPTPGGCKNWSQSTIRSILTNEKYKGDALLQKRYTVNFLTKEMRENKGEVPQYYVEHNHEAIISPEVFDQVQEAIERRRTGGNRYSGVSIYSSKIKCGDCGGWYGAKVWHSTDKYRKTIYRCNNKFKHHCQTPHLTEADIQQIFLRAVNKLITEKQEIIENIRDLQQTLCQTGDLEKAQAQHEADMKMLAGLTEQCIAENARIAQDQSAYQKRYDDLARRYDEAKKAYEEASAAIKRRKTRAKQLDAFIQTLEGQEPVKAFDETLWSSLVDFLTVHGEGDVRVTFKDGTEIRA